MYAECQAVVIRVALQILQLHLMILVLIRHGQQVILAIYYGCRMTNIRSHESMIM
jgi:hypothetical protein